MWYIINKLSLNIIYHEHVNVNVNVNININVNVNINIKAKRIYEWQLLW